MSFLCAFALLRSYSGVETNIENIEAEIREWVINNDNNLNGLIQSERIQSMEVTSNTRFTYSGGLSLWQKQMFGGTQARSLKIVRFQSIDNPSCSGSETFIVEFVFSLFDNFGLNTEESTWLPGMAEQWVLQHYRNGYTGDYKAFSPIIRHEIEFHHSFEICVP